MGTTTYLIEIAQEHWLGVVRHFSRSDVTEAVEYYQHELSYTLQPLLSYEENLPRMLVVKRMPTIARLHQSERARRELAVIPTVYNRPCVGEGDFLTTMVTGFELSKGCGMGVRSCFTPDEI